jgi:hypothetical protein
VRPRTNQAALGQLVGHYDEFQLAAQKFDLVRVGAGLQAAGHLHLFGKLIIVIRRNVAGRGQE